MKLLRKTFVLEGLENFNADFIEKFIQKTGVQPLRWAVVEVTGNKFCVEAVVIE